MATNALTANVLDALCETEKYEDKLSCNILHSASRMSLYDGLGLDTKEVGGKESKSNLSGWGSNMKLLQTHKELQAKKASLLNIKKRNTTSVAPVVDLRGRGNRGDPSEVRFNHLTGKMEKVGGGNSGGGGGKNSPLPPLKSSPFIASDGGSSFLGVADEYDPMFPNEFETYMKEVRERRARERDEQRKKEMEERERRRKERHKEQGYSDTDSSGEERERSPRRRQDDERDQRRGGAAIAPPPSLLEDNSNDDDQAPKSFGQMNSVASKIMAKMGYKEGEGLGRDNQGMSMALMVEKTSKRGGKIIHERDIQKMEPMAPPPMPAPAPTTNLLKNPSKVVLLRNMVGPGEVDEELEGEITEECTKYGKILKCMIFEMKGVVEEEAVRIFLEFEKVDSAIKAVIDLNGRYFGGRLVAVCFYNLDKFRRLDLADPIDT